MADDYIVDAFDRIRGGLEGRPDVTRTRISTVRSVDPLVGNVSTFLIESVKVRDEGTTVFLEVASRDGNVRLVIPPRASNAIARQREALVTQVRSKLGKAQAQARAEAGIAPFGGKRFQRKSS